MENTPEFYTGAPVDPVDLRFRGAFLAELWQTLRTRACGPHGASANRQDQRHGLPARPSRERILGGVDQRSGPDPSGRLLPGAARWIPRCASGFRARSACRRLGTRQRRARKGRRNRCRRLQAWAARERSRLAHELASARGHVSRPNSQNRYPDSVHHRRVSDMLLNLSRDNEGLLREFLAWFRTQRQNPAPAKDSIRWLVGGLGQSGGHARRPRAGGSHQRSRRCFPACTHRWGHRDLREGDAERAGCPLRRRRSATAHRSPGPSHPLFMQMSTQDLYRLWKREQRRIVAADVDTVFDAMVVGSFASGVLKSWWRKYHA